MPAVDLTGFDKASATYCVSDNRERIYTKRSLSSCLGACRSKANCACVSYREEQEQNCKVVYAADWLGTTKSKAKPIAFDAYMRAGVKPSSRQPRQVVAAAAAAAAVTASRCRAGTGLSLVQPDAAATPPFFLYPLTFDADALHECYTRRNGHAWNTSLDPSLWVYQALQQHSSRVRSAAQAEVFFVPSLAQLSEAAGSCTRAGGSHYARMLAAANALKQQPSFQQRPTEHLLVNGVVSAMRNPLGELGGLVSSRGGRAACLDVKLCGAFKGGKMLPLPWAASPTLQRAVVRELVDNEACGVKRSAYPFGERRSATLFFRGGLGASKEGQELRVRIPLLRKLSGTMIGITGGDKMMPPTYEYLAKNGIKGINRLRKMEGDVYTRTLLKAKYCLVPPADHLGTPGGRLLDAVATGCVPILVGIEPEALPLAHQLRYETFSGAISRRDFLRDPVYHVEALLGKLEAGYPQMLRALADARPRLLYGVGEHGPLLGLPASSTAPLTAPSAMPAQVEMSGGDANATTSSRTTATVVPPEPPRFGDVAGLLLREFKMAVAATPPSEPEMLEDETRKPTPRAGRGDRG